MLLEDERPVFGQTFGQLIAKLLGRAVQLRLGAPTHARGVHEHLLGAHPQNHVRVGAHPHPGLPDLAKQRIELRAVETVLNRVDPDQHSIEFEQLIANGIHGLIGVHDRHRIDSERRKGTKHLAQLARRGDRDVRVRRVPLHPPEKADPHDPSLRSPGFAPYPRGMSELTHRQNTGAHQLSLTHR